MRHPSDRFGVDARRFFFHASRQDTDFDKICSMKTTTQPRQRQLLSCSGEPTWEGAQFYPPQGEWTEAYYLGLQTNHLVELSDGFLEILPMPTHKHQMIVAFLYGLLKAF